MVQIFAAPAERGEGHRAAWALLDHACRRRTGAPMPAAARTALGKPYFPGGGPEFSLTHTRGLAACAVSDGPVGLDAELRRPLRPGVAERTMNPAELAWMAAQEDPETAFFILWTMKEAWSKLCGAGLRGRPRDIRLCWPGGVPTVEGQEAAFATRVHAGVVLTLCTPVPAAAEWAFLKEIPG